MTTGCQKEGGSSEEPSALLETEKETLVRDFRAQADDRVRNADKPQAADAVPSAAGQKIKFPAEVRSSK